MPASWIHILDQCVQDIFSKSKSTAPPVDAVRIANSLEFLLATDFSQAGRARFKQLGDHSLILVRPDDRPERIQWAVAHELGETLAHRIVKNAGINGFEDDLPCREEIANRFASRLLLPAPWFDDDARRCGGDLPTLKNIYRTASHESIAWRLLDLEDSTVITICDQGNVSARRGNRSCPGRMHPIERAVWEESHHNNQPEFREDDSVRIQCWPIHEINWKREILRTTSTSSETM